MNGPLVISNEMLQNLMFTHTSYIYIGITLVYLYMNVWLELDYCLSVAQLVIALHQNRRVAGPIIARGSIVAFSATIPG